MKDYKKKYYEQSDFWDIDYLKIPAEKERIKEIIEIIPSDVQTVLDVGCGNGSFVNMIKNTFPNRFDKIIGLDTSKEALKHVKTAKLEGSIVKLPFRDKSFDLVTCLEVLEHLPQIDFEKGILELQRVTKKYIIITVPNNENLDMSLIQCPKCHCWFNPYYHVRSFNKNIIHNLFTSFKSIKIKEIGPVIKYRSYNRLLLTFYRVWVRPLPPETAICPQCGYQHKKEEAQNIKHNNVSHSISRFLPLFKLLVKIIWRPKKKKKWLLALYRKADG